MRNIIYMVIRFFPGNLILFKQVGRAAPVDGQG
jgi:hypothetical protein